MSSASARCAGRRIENATSGAAPTTAATNAPRRRRRTLMRRPAAPARRMTMSCRQLVANGTERSHRRDAVALVDLVLAELRTLEELGQLVHGARARVQLRERAAQVLVG